MQHTAAEVADIKVMEEAHFKIIDTNGDDKLTLTELATRETSSSEFQAEFEAKELLDLVDGREVDLRGDLNIISWQEQTPHR